MIGDWAHGWGWLGNGNHIDSSQCEGYRWNGVVDEIWEETSNLESIVFPLLTETAMDSNE